MKVHVPFDQIAEKAFVDIPSSRPQICIPLPRVGISNRPHYIRAKDPFTGELREFLADSSFSFPLPATQRGLHMSRIEECLAMLRRDFEGTLNEYVIQLSQELLRTQGQSACTVELNVQYEKQAEKNRSLIPSSELLTLHAAADASEKSVIHSTGMTVPFMNACPCTQRWGMRSFYDKLKRRGYEEDAARELVMIAPLQAHTNLGKATLKLRGAAPNFGELYSVLDQSVSIVRELLKGIDEDDFVRRVHEGGQFCEDGARAIVQNVVRNFGGRVADDTTVWVHVVVDESVHFHDLHAELTTTMGELCAVFAEHDLTGQRSGGG